MSDFKRDASLGAMGIHQDKVTLEINMDIFWDIIKKQCADDDCVYLKIDEVCNNIAEELSTNLKLHWRVSNECFI